MYFAVIIDCHNHIIGTGYNGAPKGYLNCTDGGCPRAYSDVAARSEYTTCVAIHAEANAILHSDWTARKDGCTLYVNGTPCWDCAKLISNSGITRLVFRHDFPGEVWDKAEDLLIKSNISITKR
jgi:dCMP deaminase